MKDRESRLGRFIRSSVLGTAPRDGDPLQTIVRLEFETRAVYNPYISGPRRLLGLIPFPDLPPLRFLPASDVEFVAFSLEGGGLERRLSFEQRDGTTVLVLATAAGPITARRAKQRTRAAHCRRGSQARSPGQTGFSHPARCAESDCICRVVRGSLGATHETASPEPTGGVPHRSKAARGADEIPNNQNDP